jgi:hypothetical protein
MTKDVKTALAVTVAWAILTCAILGVDYLGVRVLSLNGLVFNVLIYWYGISELVSMLTFWAAVHWIPGRKVNILSVAAVTALTAVWWLATFILLMQTHGAIGGWY